MQRSLLKKYNSPKPEEIWQMKEECHQYYINCFNRFKAGEQFHPLGFARIDYPSTVLLLVRTLSFLGDEDVLVFGRNRVLRLHFNLNFEYVAIIGVNWSNQYVIPNFFERDVGFRVYPAQGVLTEKQAGRKIRFVVLNDGRRFLMDCANFLRQPRISFNEQSLPPRFIRRDWLLVLNREVSNFYNRHLPTPKNSPNPIILKFPTLPKT